MKVWLTKYALTHGITEAEAEAVNETMIIIRPTPEDRLTGALTTYYHKPDWHTSRDEAVEQAEKLRVAKIKSLEKSLKKMKEKVF